MLDFKFYFQTQAHEQMHISVQKMIGQVGFYLYVRMKMRWISYKIIMTDKLRIKSNIIWSNIVCSNFINISTQSNEIFIMQVQYRNCTYIGGFQEYQRQGYGMILFDNSNILLAKWKANQIDGPYAFISDKINAFGTMIEGRLEGYNVLSIKQSQIKPSKNQNNMKGIIKDQQQRAFFCMYRDNRPYGKFILVNKGQGITGQYIQGQIRQISPQKARYDIEIHQLLQKNFPNRPYRIESFITELIMNAEKQNEFLENCKFVPCFQEYENSIIFLGYSEIARRNKKIGFVMSVKGEMMTIGEHQEIYLDGLGRAYKNGVIQDGVFKGGSLNGIGIRYFVGPHRYQLGQYGRGQGLQKGFGFPLKQIVDIRKQFHLRAIQFYNDIVVLSIGTLFEAIMQNTILQLNHKQSPRFTGTKNQGDSRKKRGFGEKSPVKSRLDKYQQQSDQIDDTSPIKQPMDSYSRVDFPPQEAQNSRVSNNRSNKHSNQHYNYEAQREPTRKTRLYENRKKQSDERSTRSGKKIQDTKTFVKQLDERQKHKRSYLDQIYRDAKLYRNK